MAKTELQQALVAPSPIDRQRFELLKLLTCLREIAENDAPVDSTCH
ncbi:MAG: hypothetical protein WBN92_11100 [Terriglobia bacterium]